MPADAKLKFRTNTRTEGKSGGHVSGTNCTNKGEFTFSFWASLYAGDAATPLASRKAATNAMYDHLRLCFGFLMSAGANGKRIKTDAMFRPAKTDTYSAGKFLATPRTCCSTVAGPSASRSRSSARCSTTTCPTTTTLRLGSRRRLGPLARCAARSSAPTISLSSSREGLRWRRPGGFAVRLRVVVPHGRVGAAAD